MPYEIKNPNSTAPAEHISDDKHAEMKKAGKLRGYDVTKVNTPAKPAELTAEKSGPKTGKTEDK